MRPDSQLIGRIFDTHFSSLLGVIKWALQLAYAVASIAAFIAFFINIAKLAKSSGNPRERSDALHGIAVSGGCIAVLGGIGLVFLLVLSFMA